MQATNKTNVFGTKIQFCHNFTKQSLTTDIA